jgi:Beta-galactosidase/beta-glucuronidase
MNSIPRPEYPRPRLVRGTDTWQNLNGVWEFMIDAGRSGEARRLWEAPEYPLSINVPFAPESKLSGITVTDFLNCVWYRRSFTLENKHSARTLLRFGAVDYEAKVWVNGKFAGSHLGGYTPFALDITKLLVDGDNTVTVCAYDDASRDPMQPSGKQSPDFGNFGCMYTRSTGIWQTVWLEFVPEIYITGLKLTPDLKNRKLRTLITLNKPCGGLTVTAAADNEGDAVATSSATVCGNAAELELAFPYGHEIKTWSPESPFLYGLTVMAGDDVCSGYFGMRSVEVSGNKFLLNGKSVFQRLVLDQGYYPDGIYTAPDVSDIENDIILSKKVGFNGARLHMKVFEPYASYYADKLGYLLWGEYPNWGLDDTRAESLCAMLPEWLEAVERDYSSPAIIGWCPFNETGPNRSERVFRSVQAATRAADPYRPIIDSSGYFHVYGLSDIHDVHDYEQDPTILKAHFAALAGGDGKLFTNFPDYRQNDYPAGKPFFVSEFGGTHWDIDSDGSKGWGYGASPESLEEFYTRFNGLISALLDNPGICAFCYTQLTDVMQEKNGIYAFDRREKFEAARLHAIMTRRAAIEE